MARGGYGQGGGWGSLADRITPPTPSPMAGAHPEAARARPELDVKHCWVIDQHGRLPGLLLGWRRIGDEWQGRVVRPAYDEAPGLGWVVVEEWIPAGCLDPG